MYLIPASHIVANYFIHNPQYTYMCEDTLKRIKKALESSFRKMNVSVAIDISQPAIKEIEN
jgi:hypothetical protein